MTQPVPTQSHNLGPTPGLAVHPTAHPGTKVTPARSVLAWPAWLRVLAVLPVVLALWLAVWWANMGTIAW